MTHQEENSRLTVPVAIVIAGFFIALALYLGAGIISGGTKAPLNAQARPSTAAPVVKAGPLTPADHIRGNLNAKTVIVEYSDTECPFCKNFHVTLSQLYAKYSANNQIAWVYRPFPLNIHPKAHKEAEALECATELGGNDKFWAFTDRIFEITPSNNGLDPAELPNIAKYVGLDVTKFNACLASGKYSAKIDASVKEGLAAGVRGTPTSIIFTAKGQTPISSGAVPLEQLEALIK